MNKWKLLIPPLPGQQSRWLEGEGDRVVLLHGLWRSVWAMEGVARFLNQEGFETLNVPYGSFFKEMDEIVDWVAEEVGRSEKPTHFVTHSMGGVVLRHLAARYPELVTGKVVMLAPPNQGSEIVDWLEDSVFGKMALGPGGLSLSTDKMREVPGFSEDQEVMVLMGCQPRMPFFKALLGAENDGIVGVDGGRVEGLDGLEVFQADHSFIMSEEEVLARILELLKVEKRS